MKYILVLYILSWFPLIFLPPNIGAFFWIIIAMTGQAGILSYSWITSRFGLSLSSRANTIVNLGTFVIAFFVQWLIGVIIDLFPLVNGSEYNPVAYDVSFMVLLLMQIIALIWFLRGENHLKLEDG